MCSRSFYLKQNTHERWGPLNQDTATLLWIAGTSLFGAIVSAALLVLLA